MSKKYTIKDIDEDTYRLFAECGKKLNEPNANACFRMAVKALATDLNKKEVNIANKKFIEQIDDYQLHPSNFEESNTVMLPPAGKTEQDVHSLCAALVQWGEYPAVVSCWKPTREHLKAIEATGRVWVTCLGAAMPPIVVSAKNPLDYNGIELV